VPITLLGLFVAACAGPAADAPACGTGRGPHLREAAQLFQDQQIIDVHVALPAEAAEALRRDPRSYARGCVAIGASAYPDAGIRLKGHSSFRPLDDRPSLTLRLSGGGAGDGESARPPPGLGRLHLHSMVQDRSMVHESLAYRVFRELGVPAPRTGYVRLWLDGSLAGLYLAVESVDRQFLRDHFGEATGDLFEASFDDLAPEYVQQFEHDQVADPTRAPLRALVQRVTTTPEQTFFAERGSVDTAPFLGFLAAEAVIGHWDGYHKSHNYRLYHRPDADRWVFLPWGTDQTFEIPLGPFDSQGRLAQLCFQQARCRASYAARLLEAVERLDELAAHGAVEALAAHIAADLAADPRRPFHEEVYRLFQAQTSAYLRERGHKLRPAASCHLDPTPRDADGDGHAACTADCDDTDPAIHPAAPERCNQRNDDCNGLVDEPHSCGCTEERRGSHRYLFCAPGLPAAAAAAHCTAQGGTLAVLEDVDEQTWLWHTAQRFAARPWRIGYQRGAQGWLWADGSSATYLDWAPGFPEAAREACAVLHPAVAGRWTSAQCSPPVPFVCELPAAP
jgi:hypothetical protein